MRFVAAYLLLALGGNKNITAADIKKVVAAGNGSADDAEINKLLEELKGKDLEAVLKAGREKLSSVPAGAGAAASSAAPAAASGGDAKKDEGKKDDKGGKKEEKKKEEKKEEKAESEDMGFDLFG